MKVLSGLVLVAAIALVQGRSAVQRNVRTPAQSGEFPERVHLRFAQDDGTLGTCEGTLIHNRWILSTASCLGRATFLWARYDAVQVPHPGLVTESSRASGAFILHPDADGAFNNIALLSINRNVEFTDGIQSVALESSIDASNNLPEETVPLCSWGLGDQLICSSIEAAGVVTCPTVGGPNTDDTICSIGAVPADANIGTPLIVGGKLVGILALRSDPAEGSDNAAFSVFTRVGKYHRWIESVTDLEFEEREEVDVAPLP